MKINKKDPKHWLILLTSGVLLLCALPLRLLKFLERGKSAVLYGHKLNGNLLALYEYGKEHHTDLSIYYLSIDPRYIKELRRESVSVLSGLNIKDLATLVMSDAIITDHGLHHFVLLRKLTGIKFIDVWHGIPYKGFDAESFRALHPYDEIWVSSGVIAAMYVERFGFDADKVKPLGYARVERLADQLSLRDRLLQEYGLEDKKTLLVAPTWKQDAAQRSIVPFGLSLEEFFRTLRSSYAGDLQIIFRAHLNVMDQHSIKGIEGVKIMPYADYPVAEDFVAMSDVLLTDWSSIAFDALAVDIPVVFMDVSAPFAKGFSLGPEYRFGATSGNAGDLRDALAQALGDPSAYLDKYRQVIQMSKEAAYGGTLDSKVRERSFTALAKLIE